MSLNIFHSKPYLFPFKLDFVNSSSFIEGSNVLIGHFGLVAGSYDALGICDVIDSFLPKTGYHTLTQTY